MGNLLHYAIIFLVVALVAALFGFGGIAGTAMDGAKILFWVAIVLFAISAVAAHDPAKLTRTNEEIAAAGAENQRPAVARCTSERFKTMSVRTPARRAEVAFLTLSALLLPTLTLLPLGSLYLWERG